MCLLAYAIAAPEAGTGRPASIGVSVMKDDSKRPRSTRSKPIPPAILNDRLEWLKQHRAASQNSRPADPSLLITGLRVGETYGRSIGILNARHAIDDATGSLYYVFTFKKPRWGRLT